MSENLETSNGPDGVLNRRALRRAAAELQDTGSTKFSEHLGDVVVTVVVPTLAVGCGRIIPSIDVLATNPHEDSGKVVI